MKRWLIPLTALCTAPLPSFAQVPETPHGTIRVVVVDAVGNTVEGADVYADPGPSQEKLPQCRTGKEGQCEIVNLSYGDYQIWATKGDDTYPDWPMKKFFALPNQPQVLSLSSSHPTDEEVINLGRKCGILTGTVTDAATGKHLDAKFAFRWESDPQIKWGEQGWTDTPFRIVVPSEIALTMTVTADGYAPWTYTSFSLSPGAELLLDIRLQPKY